MVACIVRNRISFCNLVCRIVRFARSVSCCIFVFSCFCLLSGNLFALAARRRNRTMPSLPQTSTVPGHQLKTRFLTTNYQQARSCRHARENLFLYLRPRAARKSNLNRSSFWTRCGICPCSWKASRQSKRQ